MSEASKTSRTDAGVRFCGNVFGYKVDVELARTLELELTALREELEATRARLAGLEELADVAYRATHIAEWWAIPIRLREELKQRSAAARSREGKE